MTTVIGGLGGALAFSSANGGKVYAFNAITTSPATVAAANSSRQRILFHNPGAVDVFIAPANVIVNGTNVALSPTTSALGGCFRVFANGGTLEITGECQGAWRAFAASGTTNPLTVMESNI